MTHLIFGALGEPGRAIAATLARRGEALLLADEPGLELEALAASLRQSGVTAEAVGWNEPSGSTGIVGRSRSALRSVICARPGRQLSPVLPFQAQAWDDFIDHTRTPWLIARACQQAGFAGTFIATGSRAAVSGPTMSGFAFLLRTMRGDGGFTARLAIGDDPATLATVVDAFVQLPPASAVALEAGTPVGDQASDMSSIADAAEPSAEASAIPRRIVVTGGAGAIAQALCEILAAASSEPLQALLVDRDGAALAAAAEHMQASGITVGTLEGDMADPSLPARAVAMACAAFGGIDAVFSHAGVGRGDPALATSEDDFDLSFAVNLRAAWLLADASDAALRESRGSFTATATIGALRPGLAPPVYSASKAALVSLVEQLAMHWGPSGVRANAVSPGPTLTPMNRLWNVSPEDRERAVGAYPLRRIADPAEVAGAMAFLAGPGASYISGHNLVVDGALSRLHA